MLEQFIGSGPKTTIVVVLCRLRSVYVRDGTVYENRPNPLVRLSRFSFHVAFASQACSFFSHLIMRQSVYIPEQKVAVLAPKTKRQ